MRPVSPAKAALRRKPPQAGSNPRLSAGQRGFTFLAVLFFIAVLGVQLAALGTLWHTAVRREKEAELLFIGDEFRRAIARFYSVSTPGGKVQRYPQSLDELLLDPRFPAPVRHLRRVYRDPMTGLNDWGLQRNEAGGIVGVHSLSTARPLKVAGFREVDKDFTGKARYDQWIFVPVASQPVTPQP